MTAKNEKSKAPTNDKAKSDGVSLKQALKEEGEGRTPETPSA